MSHCSIIINIIFQIYAQKRDVTMAFENKPVLYGKSDGEYYAAKKKMVHGAVVKS